MKNVVIVESPAKIKKLSSFLGRDYQILASFGHIRDLPSKDGSVDTEDNFKMNYKVSTGSKKHINAILAALKDAENLYLAADPDREGEAIAWHVLEEVKAKKSLMKRIEKGELKILRITFNEITKKAIKESIESPTELDMDMVNSQQARRALDYLVGFNLSPVLWRKVRKGLSAGRVQSVALRLVAEREEEIKKFNPEEYWSVLGLFGTASNAELKSKLTYYNGDKLSKFSIDSKEKADEVLAALSSQDWAVKSVEKKQSRRKPTAPFITSTLQQEASRKLGYGAKKAMMAAQKLYENGYITYMRTDSVALSTEFVGQARDTILAKYGAKYLPKSPINYSNKSKNAQEAHEAVRPTDPNMLKGDLKNASIDEQKLYDLIWKRTMASQMENALLDQTGVDILSSDTKHTFRATGSVIAFDGFLKAYREGTDDGKSDGFDEDMMPKVIEGEKLNVREIKPEQHFTQPPPRFSEATLVKALEEYGIGRPSTYATIVTTIQDRGYVKLEKKRFHLEDIGEIVSKFLTEHFAKYVDYGFTANLEDDLDAISRGENDWISMLKGFWKPFKEQVDDKILNVKRAVAVTEPTGETCPQCNTNELVIRLGKFGKFKACSGFPACKFTQPIEGEGPKDADGNPIVPEAPKPTGVKCPKCKEHEIVEKKSRRGKIFFACAGFPKCKYPLWDRPIAEACPKCKWPIITEKETKKDGLVRKCPECNFNLTSGEVEAPAKAKNTKKNK
ncbi:MAG: type I DNA topoisomerase [Proteobacteria bacterium]|nr:type I DNA topoisomerase [Pseudomonadota bacterium]